MVLTTLKLPVYVDKDYILNERLWNSCWYDQKAQLEKYVIYPVYSGDKVFMIIWHLVVSCISEARLNIQTSL